MRQVVLEQPGIVRVTEVEPPHLQPGQVLVRLRSGGICGSDLAAFRGTSPLVSYPRVLGHELLVDVLDAPSRPELMGRRAVVEPLVSCGRCRPCRRGRSNCCVNLQVLGVHVDGGLCASAALDTEQLYAVPDDMPDDVAVLAEPTSIAYRAVQRSGIEAGQIAVVFGAGTIGLLITQLLLRARGCRALVIDVDPWRLEVAKALGATPMRGEPAVLTAAVQEATDGNLADVVFEATGNAACTRLTADLVASTGRIVLIGWNKGPVEVDTVTLMRKEAELYTSRNSTGAFPAVLRLLADGVIDASRMITHRFPLDEAAEAMALLDGGREPSLKIVLTGS